MSEADRKQISRSAQGDGATSGGFNAEKVGKGRSYMLSNPLALRYALKSAEAKEIKVRHRDGTAAATSA
jgi:hypothetical protein